MPAPRVGTEHTATDELLLIVAAEYVHEDGSSTDPPTAQRIADAASMFSPLTDTSVPPATDTMLGATIDTFTSGTYATVKPLLLCSWPFRVTSTVVWPFGRPTVVHTISPVVLSCALTKTVFANTHCMYLSETGLLPFTDNLRLVASAV
jgi:hypothetical protein